MSTAAPITPLTYSTGVQAMHWVMGGSMLASVGLVLLAQNTKDKKEKGQYMFYHKSFGAFACALLVPRLAIRLTSKLPGPIEGTGQIENMLASAGHLAMYGFAIFLPVSGVAMGYFGGAGVPFFFTTIPAGPKNGDVAKQAYKYHKLVGKAFEYFIPLHVGGALLHMARGQVVFARIVPGLKASK
eukprot:CAMPEP_0182427520 /NCGR_PEP_ID=MMETSP1167-20130531/18156_1 /TAXON_ID=2988 /ORGANISM="Mallomonas Sp, Strain CCMP3275" /LENGTH=184 /DNA_ID=CAMNT_0024609825 /DNA_START=102 /DNA_END=656 /DNA_ORIENTATION=+